MADAVLHPGVELPRDHPPPRAGSRRVVRAGLVEVGGNVALRLATVLQTVVVARLYAAEDLGHLGTALLVVGAVTSISTLGLDRYLLALREDGNLRSQLDVAFTLSLLAGAVGTVLVLVAAPWLDLLFRGEGLPGHLRILSPLVLGTALSLPTVLWERQLRYGWTKLPALLGVIAFVSVAVSGRLLWGWGGSGLVIAQLASFGVASASLWVLAPTRPRLRWHAPTAGRQLTFGFPLLLAGLTTFIAGQGDDFLVRYFYDDTALGLYLVAFYLPSYVLALAEMLARVSVPSLAPLRDSLPELKHAFATVSRYIAAVSVGLGGLLALFADEVVGLLYGAQWEPVVPLVRIFSVGFILRATTGFHWQTLAVLFGRTRYLMWTSVASAGFMIVLATPLVWKFGLLGGAIYSLVQLGVMGPLVRFPLIRQTLGDLSYLSASVPALLAGALAATTCVLMQVVVAAPGAWALGGYVAVYTGALLWWDPALAGSLRAALAPARGAEG